MWLHTRVHSGIFLFLDYNRKYFLIHYRSLLKYVACIIKSLCSFFKSAVPLTYFQIFLTPTGSVSLITKSQQIMYIKDDSCEESQGHNVPSIICVKKCRYSNCVSSILRNSWRRFLFCIVIEKFQYDLLPQVVFSISISF